MPSLVRESVVHICNCSVMKLSDDVTVTDRVSVILQRNFSTVHQIRPQSLPPASLQVNHLTLCSIKSYIGLIKTCVTIRRKNESISNDSRACGHAELVVMVTLCAFVNRIPGSLHSEVLKISNIRMQVAWQGRSFDWNLSKILDPYWRILISVPK